MTRWRKSSHSMNHGDCVEAASWRKSSRCNGGECVEAASFRKSTHSANSDCLEAGNGDGIVGIRDSKDEGCGPVLEFSTTSWRTFTAALKGAP